MIWMMYLGLWDLKLHTEPTEWQAKCPKFWYYTNISSKFRTLLGILHVGSILCKKYIYIFKIYIYIRSLVLKNVNILASPGPPMCPVVQLAMLQGKPGGEENHLQQERCIECYHVHGSKNGANFRTKKHVWRYYVLESVSVNHQQINVYI